MNAIESLLLFVLGIFWLILPFLLLDRLGKLIAELKTLNYSAALLLTKADELKQAIDTIPAMTDAAARAREINS